MSRNKKDAVQRAQVSLRMNADLIFQRALCAKKGCEYGELGLNDRWELERASQDYAASKGNALVPVDKRPVPSYVISYVEARIRALPSRTRHPNDKDDYRQSPFSLRAGRACVSH